MTERPRIEIGEIVAGLTDRIEDLCFALFPAGYVDQREFCIGSVAGEEGQSLRCCVAGAKAGVWCDFADRNMKGDALDLVAQALYRGDKRPAIVWAKAWLGLDDTAQPAAPNPRQAVPKQKRQTVADYSGRARQIWMGAQPSLRGTPAERYLKSRGIDLNRLGRQPGALRFVPWLHNTESDRSWPAIVTAISDAEGRQTATHRLWLAEDGSDKAPLTKAKKVLGPYQGGAIRLWRGITQKPLKDAPPGDELVLCEGIEDGLTVAQECPWLRVMAAISVSNLANIALPPSIATVTIMADNDPPNPNRDDGGSEANDALNAAIARFMGEGRKVRVARSPVGKDINDLLRSRMKGAEPSTRRELS
jgi:hypothetical protein